MMVKVHAQPDVRSAGCGPRTKALTAGLLGDIPFFRRRIWLRNRHRTSRPDPPDPVGTCAIGPTTQVGDGKPEYRPNPRPERHRSGPTPSWRMSGRTWAVTILESFGLRLSYPPGHSPKTTRRDRGPNERLGSRAPSFAVLGSRWPLRPLDRNNAVFGRPNQCERLWR